MFDQDIRLRARRLLNGDRRITDLDRIYLGLRGSSRDFGAFVEIGNFVAHRDQRCKGLVSQVGRDIYTSLEVWSRGLRGVEIRVDDILRAADANLRLLTDEQLKKGCGRTRQDAKTRVERIARKMARGDALTPKEFELVNYVSNRFVWRPAFSDVILAREFMQVLSRAGVAEHPTDIALVELRTFLALHALSVMHGSAIALADGHTARLLAGFANKGGHLEVKMEVVFHDADKPILAPVCLFLTDLRPEDHCESDLLAAASVLPDHWPFPIEVNEQGKLSTVRAET